ncbi:MAG: 4Fe-4S dicluster domain-containing protein [Clostridiales bacterium]|jgi:2-oxoglutarate ferredoxin oxidoreductase subunit delta|nr:4Fe-4S dicluster domain-containing protein [Clostridiales bacterium]
MNKVTFNVERCKGCGLCVSVCPKKILELGENLNSKGYHPSRIKDQEKCIACAMCAVICPDTVITVEKDV